MKYCVYVSRRQVGIQFLGTTCYSSCGTVISHSYFLNVEFFVMKVLTCCPGCPWMSQGHIVEPNWVSSVTTLAMYPLGCDNAIDSPPLHSCP